MIELRGISDKRRQEGAQVSWLMDSLLTLFCRKHVPHVRHS